MPSQSSDNSDPVNWQNPPIAKELHEEVKKTMPAYSKRMSQVRGMGVIVEAFLRCEGIIRSSHPQVSFCGLGKDAAEILSEHKLDYGLYKDTPVEKMYQRDVKILLAGVDYDSCTLIHYAEYEAGIRSEIQQGSSVIENGNKIWKEYKEIDLDSDVFVEIGKVLEREGNVVIGSSNLKVMSAKIAIDTAIKYLKEN